jgi:hypothetical protein
MPSRTPNATPGVEQAHIQQNPTGLQASKPGNPMVQPAVASTGGSGVSSTLGNMAGDMFSSMQTPEGLAGMLTNPALRGIVKPMMQYGGAPLMLGGANALLHSGRDIGNIMKGPIGMGNT